MPFQSSTSSNAEITRRGGHDHGDHGDGLNRRAILASFGLSATVALAQPSRAQAAKASPASASGINANLAETLKLGHGLNIVLPDSRPVADAFDRMREESQPWLVNHVMRSWVFGAKLAQMRGLKPDGETLAVSILLHDMGLARGGAADRRFEVVGADFGKEFALAHGMGETRANTVWDSIALHTLGSIARFKGPEVASCLAGIACDYAGMGYKDLSDSEKKLILTAYPRLKLKSALTTCLCQIAEKHPATTKDNFVADFGERYIPGYTRPSSVDALQKAPFDE